MFRGLWTHGSVLYSVEGNKLYSIDSASVRTELATLNSTSGTVDFESNLSQLCITDGSRLYVYTPLTSSITQATNYPGGDRISFLNQRINFLFRGTQKFGWTPLGSATTIDPLAFASAESNPDTLVSQVAFNSELVLLGQYSTEIWDPTGTDAVYAKSSAAIDYGCVAAFSAQKSANSLFWLGQEQRGRAVVLQMQGHQARRISNRAIEEKLEGLNLARATAFTYSDGGQSFYCLNVPGLDTTWVYDETFNQWHERAEWDGDWSQWRPTCHAFAYGKHYFGAGDDLYVLDRQENTYGGDTKRRQRIAPVISSPNRNRVFFRSLEIVCQKGSGGSVSLDYSDDNGANWSNTLTTSMGAVGNFAHRVKFNRLGSAYDRVFRVTATDDAPFNPVAVNVPLNG